MELGKTGTRTVLSLRVSEDVNHLMVAEQRRFLKELKSSKKKDASALHADDSIDADA